MIFRVTALALATLMAAAPLSLAAKGAPESLVFDPQVFETQRQELEEAVRRSDRYAEIRSSERSRVFDALAAMSVLLADVESIDELAMEQRVEVFNLQEEINTILTRAAESSRLVCERQTRTGSHMTRTQCQTVADRKATRERGQELLRDATRRQLIDQPDPGRVGGIR
ncbi:MAG: hypothetical protein KDJ14_07490 [Xanthomonadales bacterium]|nr:hypothetical protein [Xanthomonadales bacterium]